MLRIPVLSAIRWLWRWLCALALYAFLQMSVLTLSLVLAVPLRRGSKRIARPNQWTYD